MQKQSLAVYYLFFRRCLFFSAQCRLYRQAGNNTHKLVPVFDRNRPIRSTGDMMTWHTAKPCAYTHKSHINFCVYDSAWEASEAFHLDHNPNGAAWVKNDHLDLRSCTSTGEWSANTGRTSSSA
ncbi:MAG: hypothetical protein U5L00_15705 [Desulfovermiculus sp.]|nr:hypothetical protein [Desulfovermiculus sp.]